MQAFSTSLSLSILRLSGSTTCLPCCHLLALAVQRWRCIGTADRPSRDPFGEFKPFDKSTTARSGIYNNRFRFRFSPSTCSPVLPPVICQNIQPPPFQIQRFTGTAFVQSSLSTDQPSEILQLGFTPSTSIYQANFEQWFFHDSLPHVSPDLIFFGGVVPPVDFIDHWLGYGPREGQQDRSFPGER